MKSRVPSSAPFVALAGHNTDSPFRTSLEQKQAHSGQGVERPASASLIVSGQSPVGNFTGGVRRYVAGRKPDSPCFVDT
jgi:hypothetical protein